MGQAEFCIRCGQPLSTNGVCLNTLCDGMPQLPAPPAELTPGSRLGAGSLDFGLALVVELFGLLLSPFTATLSGVLASLFNTTYVALRDLGDGGLSRRATGSSVLDADSGVEATTPQKLIRNAPYALAFLFAALPDPFGMLGVFFVCVMLSVDLGLLVTGGRRLGDLLARTRVAVLPRKP